MPNYRRALPLVERLSARFKTQHELTEWASAYASTLGDPRYRLDGSLLSRLAAGALPTIFHMQTLAAAAGVDFATACDLLDLPIRDVPRWQLTLNAPWTRFAPPPLIDLRHEALLPVREVRWSPTDGLFALEDELDAWGVPSPATFATWTSGNLRYAHVGVRDGMSQARLPPRAWLQLAHVPADQPLDAASYYLVEHPAGRNVCACHVEDPFVTLVSERPELHPTMRWRRDEIRVRGRVRAFAASLDEAGAEAISQDDLDRAEAFVRRAERADGRAVTARLLARERALRGESIARTALRADVLSSLAGRRLGLAARGWHELEHATAGYTPTVGTLLTATVLASRDLRELALGFGVRLDGPQPPRWRADRRPDPRLDGLMRQPERGELLREWGEYPALLHYFWPNFRGSRIFRLRQTRRVTLPHLGPEAFLVVDTQDTQLPIGPVVTATPPWGRALHVVQVAREGDLGGGAAGRNTGGRYLVGYCRQEGSQIHVFPEPGSHRWRTKAPATPEAIVGRVVAVAVRV